MSYLYETHCHDSLCSACAHSAPAELVRAYHAAGYAGLVITNHFIWGSTAVDRTLPWAEFVQHYIDAYQQAKAAGDALDFDVLFGIEHAYDGKEVLCYGLDGEFLLSNPDIPQITIREFTDRVHRYGGVVIQAHPYRCCGREEKHVLPEADVDGIEVYNACNKPEQNLWALQFAERKNFILTSGGDIHIDNDPRIGSAGILLPHRVRDGQALSEALKQRSHQYLVNGRPVSNVREQDLVP